MIITSTPYIISFFGGGTDHPLWYKENFGKILGAVGGWLILFFAKPEYHSKIKESLRGLTFVPFKFENSGSKLVLYQPNSF